MLLNLLKNKYWRLKNKITASMDHIYYYYYYIVIIIRETLLIYVIISTWKNVFPLSYVSILLHRYTSIYVKLSHVHWNFSFLKLLKNILYIGFTKSVLYLPTISSVNQYLFIKLTGIRNRQYQVLIVLFF